MKYPILKIIVIPMLVFFLSCLHVNAQSPFGHYICRYILTKDNSRVNYHRIYNPLTISHYGIRVENTNAGVKTWKTEYKGTFYKKIGSKLYLFHKLYLTNQFVIFWISDKPVFLLNGEKYFVIKIDG